MNRRRAALAYAGHVIVVEANEADIDWLLEFLLPDFDLATSDRPPDVIVHDDDGRVDAMLNEPRHSSGDTLECFAMDGRMQVMPRWESDARHMVGYDESTDAFLHVDIATGRTLIVARPGRRATRTILLRTVREIASDAVVAAGGIVLHGAAIACEAGALVIAGAKEAGKTTLLLNLLSRQAGGMLANDRVTARLIDGRWIARGMPTIVNVRGSSLAYLPHFAERFYATNDHHRYSLRERDQQPAMPAARPAWSLTPSQLCVLLNTRRSAQQPLAAVLFPRRTGTADGLAMTPLTPSASFDRAAEAVFRSGQSAQVAGLFRRASGDAPPLHVWRTIVDTVPCFDCALGTDVYGDAESARLVDTIASCSARR